MSSAAIAVYSIKGGVGKTSFAVNFAWAAACESARRTLLWDLDAQGGASYLIGDDKQMRRNAASVLTRDSDPEKLIRPSRIDGVDLLAADPSLRSLDRLFFDIGKKKRLTRLIEKTAKRYDRIILDCPPGLGDTTEQILRAANLVVVPVIPSPLAAKALDDLMDFLREEKRKVSVLPVFSMADRRRNLHKAALEKNPKWPIIPYASVVEQMTDRRAAIGEFAGSSPAGRGFSELWRAVEHKLTKIQK